jgi:hypothetical protein
MPSLYRMNKYRLLSFNGPRSFRQEMDMKIREYQMNNPLVRHITNHPQSAPEISHHHIQPHLMPIGVTADVMRGPQYDRGHVNAIARKILSLK